MIKNTHFTTKIYVHFNELSDKWSKRLAFYLLGACHHQLKNEYLLEEKFFNNDFFLTSDEKIALKKSIVYFPHDNKSFSFCYINTNGWYHNGHYQFYEDTIENQLIALNDLKKTT